MGSFGTWRKSTALATARRPSIDRVKAIPKQTSNNHCFPKGRAMYTVFTLDTLYHTPCFPTLRPIQKTGYLNLSSALGCVRLTASVSTKQGGALTDG